MDLKDIGLKIKYLRKYEGLTQKQLAEKIGTTWEMISRYETGKSSPLGRIDKIAEALNVSIAKILTDNMVEDEDIPYSQNLIPLINTPFTDIHQALKETKLYYNAPQWITQKYLQPFGLDCKILDIQTTQLDKNGILFAVPEKPASDKDLVIVKSLPDKISVIIRQNIKSSQKPVATVIAWEKRFR